MSEYVGAHKQRAHNQNKTPRRVKPGAPVRKPDQAAARERDARRLAALGIKVSTEDFLRDVGPANHSEPF